MLKMFILIVLAAICFVGIIGFVLLAEYTDKIKFMKEHGWEKWTLYSGDKIGFIWVRGDKKVPDSLISKMCLYEIKELFK